MGRTNLLRLRWFAGGVAAAVCAVAMLNGAHSRPQAPGEPPARPAPLTGAWRPVPAEVPRDGKLRIIAFGAHPDDCELKVGGVAARWAALGHHVKLVSVTNGDIGHWGMAGGPLAQRTGSTT